MQVLNCFFVSSLFSGSLDEFRTLVFEKTSRIDGFHPMETSLIVEIINDTWDFGKAWEAQPVYRWIPQWMVFGKQSDQAVKLA